MTEKKKQGYGKLSKTLLGRQVAAALKGAESIFVTQFSNVSTNALGDLRKNLRKNKARYLVVKNTVGRKVVEAVEDKKAVAALIGGQCGLGITNEDAARVSKVFLTFADENGGFKINGAYVYGQVFSSDQVKQLAMLPSREELIAKALGRLQSPIAGFVGVLNQVVSGIVNVIEQIRKSKEEPKS